MSLPQFVDDTMDRCRADRITDELEADSISGVLASQIRADIIACVAVVSENLVLLSGGTLNVCLSETKTRIVVYI